MECRDRRSVRSGWSDRRSVQLEGGKKYSVPFTVPAANAAQYHVPSSLQVVGEIRAVSLFLVGLGKACSDGYS